MRGSGRLNPHPLASPRWPGSAWGRQQPYVGREAVCVAPRPPGPGLPGPVTHDFPCLSGRPANGRGRWGLLSQLQVPPQLATPDCSSGTEPGARPGAQDPRPLAGRSALLQSPTPHPPTPRGRVKVGGPERSPGWLARNSLPARSWAGGQGCTRAVWAPGAGGRAPGASALSAQRPQPCGGRREAAANLYTKCF